MAANKNFQFILEFVTKFNPGNIEAQVKALELVFKQINPELEFNTDAARDAIKQLMNSAGQLEDAMNSIDVDDLSKNIVSSVNTINDELGKIDPKEFGDKFNKAFQQINTDELASDFDRISSETQQMYDSQKKALAMLKLTGQTGSDEYKKLEKAISESEKELKKIAVASGQVEEKLSFVDKLAKVGLAADGINTIADSVGTMAAPFVELDRATQTMMTLGDEAKAMAPKMREASLVMSKELPFSAAEMQSAMTDALASGVKGGEEGIQNFAETAGKLATGGRASLESVVKGLSGTINAFGDTSEKSGQYADQMFNIVNFGVATIEELNSSLSQVTPTASSVGLSFGQVGGAVALMTQKGIPAAQATTKLNALLLEMAKPSAGISESLKAAGVSQEQFAKSIKEKGLVSALETLQAGFTKTGKTATQAFSSSEAGAAFNSLMSDMGALKQSMSDVENTTGSAQKAYEEMSKSIDVKTKQFKATLDSAFVGVIDSMGSLGPGLITVVQSMGQLAPMITAMTGLSSILGGAAGKALDFGKSIASSIIPNLFQQAAATEGANAAQMKFNAAALANPYLIAAGAIAAIVGSIKLISSALYETAQEQLDASKAQDELITKQIQAKQQEIGLVESKQNLIQSFKDSGAAAMQNKDLLVDLAKAYPGVIDSSKSYEENLKALEGQSGKTNQQLGTLRNELGNLAQQKIDLQVKMSNLEIGVEKQKIEDELQDALGNVVNDAADWAFGSSTSRVKGETLIKPYTDALYNAKDSKELEKATVDFQMAIFNDEKFKELSDEQKGKVIENIDKMSKARAAALEKNSKGIVSEYDTLKNSGMKEGEIITYLSKKYKTNKEEVEGLVKKQEESKKVAEEQKRTVEGLAEAWNNAKKSVADSLSNQKAAFLQQQSEIMDIQKKKPSEYSEEDKQRLNEWSTKKKTLLSDMQKENKILKDKEKQDKALNELLDPPIKAKKDILELIKQEIDRKNLSLEIDKMIYDQALQDKLLAENRKASSAELIAQEKNNLEILKKQKEIIIDAYKAKGLVNIDSSGKVEIAKKDAKQIEEIEKKKTKEIAELDTALKSGKIKDNEEYQRKLDETTQKFEDMKFKVKPATAQEIQKALLGINAQIQAGKAKVNDVTLSAQLDTKAVEQAITDLKLAKLEYEVEIGVRKAGDYSDVIADYQAFGEKLQSELDAINAKSNDPEKDKKVIEKEKELLENLKRMWGFRLKALESQYDEEDRIKAKQDKKDEKELEKSKDLKKRFMDIYSEKGVAKLDADFSSYNDGLDKALEKEKKQLEESKEDGLLSEESYNSKLQSIQDKYAKKKSDAEEKLRKQKLSLDSIATGMSAAQERATELDNLNKKKKELDTEIARAMSKGDVKKADELRDQLEETEELLKEKGDTLSMLAGDIGGTMTDTMANMFAGDGDAVADSWRAYFGQLAGKLKALLSAFVLDLVLSEGTKKYLMALPFPLNIAAIPVVAGAIQAGVSAIADPMLQNITSFSTGARIDKPTLAVVGDASIRGGANTEWIFRDEQLKKVIQMSNNNTALAKEMRDIKQLLASQDLTTEIKGQNIRVSQKRVQYALNRRGR